MVITVSLSPEMAQQLRQVVKEEDRTVSELPGKPSASTLRNGSGDAFSGTEGCGQASRASPPKTLSGWWTSTGMKCWAKGVSNEDSLSVVMLAFFAASWFQAAVCQGLPVPLRIRTRVQ